MGDSSCTSGAAQLGGQGLATWEKRSPNRLAKQVGGRLQRGRSGRVALAQAPAAHKLPSLVVQAGGALASVARPAAGRAARAGARLLVQAPAPGAAVALAGVLGARKAAGLLAAHAAATLDARAVCGTSRGQRGGAAGRLVGDSAGGDADAGAPTGEQRAGGAPLAPGRPSQPFARTHTCRRWSTRCRPGPAPSSRSWSSP